MVLSVFYILQSRFRLIATINPFTANKNSRGKIYGCQGKLQGSTYFMTQSLQAAFREDCSTFNSVWGNCSRGCLCFRYNEHSLISRFASTYRAIPAATFLDSFIASTTVAGPCTTSPLLKTPARVVMP